MVIVSLFLWWYTIGWLSLVRKSGMRLQATLDFFSVSLLLGTLFAPFRQIGTGRVNGPLNVQMEAWLDRLFSRGVGAVVRLLLVLLGLIVVACLAALSVVAILAWPLLPLAPLIGLLFIGVGA